jgi:hypothetical protein
MSLICLVFYLEQSRRDLIDTSNGYKFALIASVAVHPFLLTLSPCLSVD